MTSIEVASKTDAKIGDRLDSTKISVVSDGSDSELHLKIQWKTAIPNGSKLLFQVTKTDPKDTKKTSAVKSMDYPFAVNYVEKPAAAGSEKNDQDSDQKGKDTDKNEKDSDKKAKAKDGEKKAKTGSN